jgi:AcrR family transcriptional regulator
MDSVTAGSPREKAEVSEADEPIEADGSPSLPELVREPQQERSRETLRRIVESSYALLERGGPEALTVGAIARRARTSVGSFYARFDGKDELSRYLGELALGEVTASWREGLSGLTPEDNGDWEKGASEKGDSREADSEGRHPEPRDPDPRAQEPQDGVWEEVPPLLVALYSEPAARHLALLDGVEDPAPTRRERLESLLLQDLLGLLEYPARPALHALVVARTTLAAAQSLARRPIAEINDAAKGTRDSATGEAAGRNGEEEEVDEVARELGRLLDAYLRGAAPTHPASRADSDGARPARTREPVAAAALDTGSFEPGSTAEPDPVRSDLFAADSAPDGSAPDGAVDAAPTDPDPTGPTEPDPIPEPEDEDDHLADPFDVWA